MSNQKISGSLNNCALYSGIPTLVPLLQRFANDVDNLEPLKVDDKYDNYLLLKDCFADYYSFEKEDFHWLQMCDVLKPDKLEKDSFVKLQLILGPVFRDYIRLQMIKAGETADRINLLTTIQNDTGRYNALTMTEAAEFFYGPLGITTNEHPYLGIISNANLGTNNEGYLIEPTKTNISGIQFAEITVYHQHSHFEVLLPSQLNHKETEATLSANEIANAELNLIFHDEQYSNRVFCLAYENFSSGEADKSQSTLTAIKAMIHAKGCDLNIKKTQEVNFPSEFCKSAINTSLSDKDFTALIQAEFLNQQNPTSEIFTRKLLQDYQSCGNKFGFFTKNASRMVEIGQLISVLNPILNTASENLSAENKQLLVQNILKTRSAVQKSHEAGSLAGTFGLTSSRLVTKLDECLADLKSQKIISQQDIKDAKQANAGEIESTAIGL